jgi:hypothetical protein
MRLPGGHQYRCLLVSALLERMGILEVYTVLLVSYLISRLVMRKTYPKSGR